MYFIIKIKQIQFYLQIKKARGLSFLSEKQIARAFCQPCIFASERRTASS